MKKFINKLHTPTWLFILLCLILVLRIPSFFEPYSYGDELIYLTLGEAIKQGIPLYSGIHDNKPPLLYVMAAIAGNLFWFKAILAIWNLITIFLFWKLACALFPKKDKLQKIATIIFALAVTLPRLEGNIVNAELFMIGPTIAAFLILLSRKLNFKNIFLAGTLFSISTLFKIPAVFDMPAIIFLWLASAPLNRKNLKKIIINTLYLAAGFLIPILLTFVWFWLKGAFKEYLIAAYLQNFGYLSSWRPGSVQKSFLVRNGPFLIRGLIVLIGLAILYWKKGKLSKQFIFLTAWLLFTLFAVTLSERPYPHYLIQAIAPISYLFAILLAQRSLEQVLVIIPLSLAFFVPFYYKFWDYPVIPYYVRFVKFTAGKISKDTYLSSFGGEVLTKYKIASFISSSTKPIDKIFVWGDDSAIYALSKRFPPGKYVADYHIKDFSSYQETINILNSNMPEFIIILPDSSPFPELTTFIRTNYGLAETIDSTNIWKLLNPRIRALIAP